MEEFYNSSKATLYKHLTTNHLLRSENYKTAAKYLLQGVLSSCRWEFVPDNGLHQIRSI